MAWVSTFFFLVYAAADDVMLVQCYNAKLADFGLAKDGPRGDQTHVSTRVMGTYGYAAPEYVMTGLSLKMSPLMEIVNGSHLFLLHCCT